MERRVSIRRREPTGLVPLADQSTTHVHNSFDFREKTRSTVMEEGESAPFGVTIFAVNACCGFAINVCAAALESEITLTTEALEARLGPFASPPKVSFGYVEGNVGTLHKKATSNLFAHVNSLEYAARLTSEEEVVGNVPFVDVIASRQRQRLRFSVYCKDTHTHTQRDRERERSLPGFACMHPCSNETPVKTLLQRADRLC
ncbi:hypothetical protein HPB50_015514 [Hyalomma asiaticum]|uniref:Uncharacterized protein n=1 Tax=Hyalomma asiaticum TaxID=266040 RepID=A0ACB7ST55_HYAAI|nr:hypothetical protein HPB50_015514 [Hyalomma asiaticum]